MPRPFTPADVAGLTLWLKVDPDGVLRDQVTGEPVPCQDGRGNHPPDPPPEPDHVVTARSVESP